MVSIELKLPGKPHCKDSADVLEGVKTQESVRATVQNVLDAYTKETGVAFNVDSLVSLAEGGSPKKSLEKVTDLITFFIKNVVIVFENNSKPLSLSKPENVLKGALNENIHELELVQAVRDLLRTLLMNAHTKILEKMTREDMPLFSWKNASQEKILEILHSVNPKTIVTQFFRERNIHTRVEILHKIFEVAKSIDPKFAKISYWKEKGLLMKQGGTKMTRLFAMEQNKEALTTCFQTIQLVAQGRSKADMGAESAQLTNTILHEKIEAWIHYPSQYLAQHFDDHLSKRQRGAVFQKVFAEYGLTENAFHKDTSFQNIQYSRIIDGMGNRPMWAKIFLFLQTKTQVNSEKETDTVPESSNPQNQSMDDGNAH